MTNDVRQVEHELKTWRVYFEAIESGAKRFEVRRDDRDFQTGDTVRLREHDPSFGYSGRELAFRIGYVLRGFLPGHVVFALEPLTAQPAPSGWQPIESAPDKPVRVVNLPEVLKKTLDSLNRSKSEGWKRQEGYDDTGLLEKLRQPVDRGGYDGFESDALHIAAANRIEGLLTLLTTEQTMSAAWRKRAEEAEADSSKGWQQRIAAMDPWRIFVDESRCVFCGVKRQRTDFNDPTIHVSDCLWQNAVDAGQPAKDVIPPVPPTGEPDAVAAISHFFDQMEQHARDVEDPLLYDDIEAARKALKILATSTKFSLGQDWVSRVTNSTGPKVAVVGADIAPVPCKARRCSTPEPQDCDWPFCGCDPHAAKVIETLDECGMLKGKADMSEALPPASEASPAKETR